MQKDLLGGVVAVVNFQKLDVKQKDGYVTIARRWKPGDAVELRLPMPVERVYADPHVNPSDTLIALNDGVLPKSSNDHSLPRMTWWDHKGTTEWVSYRYAKPRECAGASVYWFDDTGRGGCRVPAEWRLLWKDGDAWKPVQLTHGSRYGAALDVMNDITFEPVTTRELKLEVKLKPGFSGGILEWRALPQ